MYTRIWNGSDVIVTEMDKIGMGKDEIRTKLGQERTSLDRKGRERMGLNRTAKNNPGVMALLAPLST